MKAKRIGVVGAISALAAASGLGAQAAPAVPMAQSYGELLEPIPDAVERLKLADAEEAARPAVLVKAQYEPGPGPAAHHHHHHHHHVYHRRHWHHRRVVHHHHHHHHSQDVPR